MTSNKESKAFSDAVQPDEEMNLDSMKQVESMQNRGVSSRRISNYLHDIAMRNEWLLKDFNEDATPTERTPALRSALWVILILYDSITNGRTCTTQDVFYTIDHFAPLEKVQTDDEGLAFRDNALGAHKLAIIIKNQLNDNQELSAFKQTIMVEGTEIHTALETLTGEEYIYEFGGFQTADIDPAYSFLLEARFNINLISLRVSLM
jgi:hypothetical protein